MTKSIKSKAGKEEIIKNFSTLGGRLRQIRKDMGLSQEQLAQKLGFSANTLVCKFERDKAIPTLETILKLKKLADIDLNWLLTGQVVADKELESAFEKLLKSYAAYVARSLARCFELRESNIYEITKLEQGAKNGKEIDRQLLEDLKSDLIFYTRELAKLSEEQPWLQQAIEVMLKEGKKASYEKILHI